MQGCHLHRTHLDVVLESSVEHGQVSQEGAQVGHSALHQPLRRKHNKTVLAVIDKPVGSNDLHAGANGPAVGYAQQRAHPQKEAAISEWPGKP